MMFTTLAAGLNRQGLMLTWDLNPRFTQTVPLGELAEVKVYALGDGTIVLFTTEGRVFEPDQSSFHPDDGDCHPDAPETPETGLDPQPDPLKVFENKESDFAPDDGDCHPDAVQTPETGLDPQPDPTRDHKDKWSGSKDRG
jgi:hypothetical protein